MTIDDAINDLKREYEKTIDNTYICKPVSEALYKTWLKCCQEEKRRCEEEKG